MPENKPTNNIFHEDGRIIFAIGLAPGVNLTFSLSDEDLEQLVEQRRAYRAKKAKDEKLIASTRSLELIRGH